MRALPGRRSTAPTADPSPWLRPGLGGGTRRPGSRRHVLLLATLLLLGGCTPVDQSPETALSLRAQRLCRERQAELPPQTTPREARLAYAQCLRTVDQPVLQSPDPPAERSAPSPAAGPTAAERYLYCRLHSEEIEAAAATYNRAHWMLLNERSNPESAAYRQAEAEHARALAALEKAIPPPLRAGRNLIPDAMRQFQSCERSSFE